MNAAPTRTRLLIADDHESVRMGLRFLLSVTPDFEVVGESDSVATTLEAIDRLSPDVVVLDFNLGNDTGATVLDAVAMRPNPPRVLMLSMEDSGVVGSEMARRGAAGYVTKDAPTSEILSALRKIRNTTHSTPGRAQSLTRRERDVLFCLKTDQSSKAIGRRLTISAKTVDVHKHRLRQKLGLQTELDLVRYAALFVADKR
jgi:DNA-binding NarL/FixJ family response regulator